MTTSTNCQTSSDVIRTSAANKINKFLDGVARRAQFSAMFGSTGRGKTFHSRAWAAKHDKTVYVRARTGTTMNKLRKQISEAIFRSENMSESAIVKYFLDNPGSVLIIDEAVHLIGNYNYTATVTLDSVRDIYDEVGESGGRMGVVMIFTEYTLERLEKCRISSFLAQFINRFDNHLDLGTTISYAYEIKPTVDARLPGADPEIYEFFKQFKDIRSVHKRLNIALDIEAHSTPRQPVSLPMLIAIQKQFESGFYKDEM